MIVLKDSEEALSFLVIQNSFLPLEAKLLFRLLRIIMSVANRKTLVMFMHVQNKTVMKVSKDKCVRSNSPI